MLGLSILPLIQEKIEDIKEKPYIEDSNIVFIRFWNCSDSVVFIVFFLLNFGTVPTVWYLLFLLDFIV